MKNIFKTAMAAVILLGATGCNDYFHEINWPFGGLTEEDLNRDNLKSGSMIPSMILHLGSQANVAEFQHTESLIGDVWGRTLMCAVGGPGSGNNEFSGGDTSWYSASHEGWFSNPFSETYKFYTPYVETWKFTNHDSNNSIWAIARILRVGVMHRMADIYGPIPYTKIDPEDLDLYIPYDTEETVWTAMLDDLSTAVDDLQACIINGTTSDIANFDRLYMSNMDKWLRYGNSLLLRLAVRVSNVRPDLTRLYAQKAISGGVIENNTDNAVILARPGGRFNDVQSKLYNVAYTNYSDTYAAADLACYMNGYGDNRRSAYFTTYTYETDGAETSVYFGLRAGSSMTDAQVQENVSRPNVGQFDDYPVLTAAEVAFLRAECVLQGWTVDSKSAQEFYEDGIKLSFEQWGVGGAEGYLSDSQSVPAEYVNYILSTESCAAPSTITIAWANDGKELQRIITQKYIAGFPQGHEAWCDYRRTGYPDFQPVCSGKVASAYANMKVANRMKFSVAESRNNAANLAEAITFLNGSDDYSTKLWWAK